MAKYHGLLVDVQDGVVRCSFRNIEEQGCQSEVMEERLLEFPDEAIAFVMNGSARIPFIASATQLCGGFRIG